MKSIYQHAVELAREERAEELPHSDEWLDEQLALAHLQPLLREVCRAIPYDEAAGALQRALRRAARDSAADLSIEELGERPAEIAQELWEQESLERSHAPWGR